MPKEGAFLSQITPNIPIVSGNQSHQRYKLYDFNLNSLLLLVVLSARGISFSLSQFVAFQISKLTTSRVLYILQ
jgi:hypothetical protein